MSDTPFDDIQDARSSDYTEGWEDCRETMVGNLEAQVSRLRECGFDVEATAIETAISKLDN
jgi:hypothetical protein